MLVDVERKGVGALDGLIGDEGDVAIAAVSVAELAVGVERAGGKRRAERQAFIDVVLDAVSIEGYDVDVARGREVISADQSGFIDLPEVVLRAQPSG